jgi:two-component system phosphate regulon sensor histidine kinase PhoR
VKDSIKGKNFAEVIQDDYLYSIISHEFKGKEKGQKGGVILKNEEININDNIYLINFYKIGNKKFLQFSDITPFEVYKQAKKDFVSNVSHELKTPIAVLKGAMETIEFEDDLETIRKFVKMSKKRINQMDSLINDLLVLAKLESKEEKIEKKPVKLHKLVVDVFSDLEEVAFEKNIKLINEVEKDFIIFADRKKFNILLKNLVENAIKYNKQDGKVIVSAFHVDGDTYLQVEDTGIGIPKEALPLIFERFYRVDKSRSRNIGGTGLGLSIVKHITESHNGKVYVESVFGEGSKFTVKIPDISKETR